MTALAAVQRPQIYRLWLAIRNRCNNKRGQDYRYYGGRGIRVCTRWNNFAAFAKDVGPHPGKGWTLDRRNNDGDYRRGNVRWASRKVQGRNRGYCRLSLLLARKVRRRYSEGGITHRVLAKRFKVARTTISKAIRRESWV